MNVRSLEARIGKLEAAQARPADEALLIWRRPDETPGEAVARHNGLFSAADRVMVAPWYGDGDSPEPTWHGGDFPRGLSEVEQGYLDRYTRTLCPERDGPCRSEPDDLEWTDAELFWVILAVIR